MNYHTGLFLLDPQFVKTTDNAIMNQWMSMGKTPSGLYFCQNNYM